MDVRRQAERLQERLAALRRRAGAVERDLRSRRADDWEERAIEVENDEVLERLDEGARREIAEIRAALARIESGTYERCSACGGPIDLRRLEAMPAAATCLACAAA